MTKQIITISRAFGSGGHTIGQEVAKRLGIPFYDKELVDEVAKQSGFHADFIKEAGEYAPVSSSFLFSIAVSPNPLSTMHTMSMADQLFVYQTNVIRNLAEKGPCVIVGRCADYILREHPRCVNIFVSASREDRIERLVRTRRLTPEAAEQLMDSTDEKRADYYNYYSNRTWGAAATYHLCIDSSVLGIDGTAAFAEEFIRKKLNLARKD